MAQSVSLTISIRKRWFCRPALLVVCTLHWLRIIKDTDRAAQWIMDSAMVLEVE